MDFELLRLLLLKDLRARYRTAVFGLWWDLATPICSALVYAGAFKALGVRLPPGHWPIYLVGVAAWQWTAGVMGSSPSLYGRNSRLLRRLPVRWTEHVVSSVLCEGTPFAAILCVSAAGVLAVGPIPGPSALLALPLLAAAQTAMLAGWAAAVAAAGVAVRDVERIGGQLTRLLFFATPVAFDPGILPHSLQRWLMLNPAAVFVEAWRAAFAGTLAPALLAGALLHAAAGILIAALVERFAAARLAEYA